jgi:hypothetical protein
VKLQLPGVLLLVAGGLVLLATVAFAIFWREENQLRWIEATQEDDPARAAELREDLETMSAWHMRPIGALVGLFIGGGMLAGGIAMVRARAWWLALTGAILALFPCHLCCCLAGPLGTWALVILFQADVKRAFGVGGAEAAIAPEDWGSPPT